MLSDIYYIGPTKYILPFHEFTKKYPIPARMIRYMNHLFLAIPNLFYQMIFAPDFNTNTMRDNIEQLSKMRKDFLAGRTGEFDSKEIETLRIVERDAEMFDKFQQS